jgi:hypothetical protein
MLNEVEEKVSQKMRIALGCLGWGLCSIFGLAKVNLVLREITWMPYSWMLWLHVKQCLPSTVSCVEGRAPPQIISGQSDCCWHV